MSKSEQATVAVPRADLLHAVGAAVGVVERRNTIPILSNVALRGDAGGVTVTATDLDMQHSVRVAVADASALNSTLPAAALYNLLRAVPEGADVALTPGDGRMALRAARGRYMLPTLPIEDFPVMAEAKDAVQFTVSAATVIAAMHRVRAAISTEETRYYLNGIFMHRVGDTIAFAATDGHRLGRVTIPAPEGSDGMADVIIPRKMVAHLLSALGDGKGVGDVTLTVSASRIGAAWRDAGAEHATMSKVIDGTFPDYTRVIPADNPHCLTVDPETLSPAVKRAAMFNHDKAQVVVIDLSPDAVRICYTSPDGGAAEEDVPATYSGEPMRVGLNAKYLTEMLSMAGGDAVTAHFADPTAPVRFAADGDADFTGVLMPMRV